MSTKEDARKRAVPIDGTQENSFSVTGLGAHGIVWLVLLCTLGSGCSFFRSPAHETVLSDDKAYWFDYEASRRGAFWVPGSGDKKFKVCAEPPPDVGLARTAEVLTKANYQGASGELQAKLAEQLTELGGRTQTVLILRESLFRLCEMSLGNVFTDAKLQTLFEKVIDGVLKLAEADLKKAEAKSSKADSERLNALKNLLPTLNQDERMKLLQ